MAMPILPIGPAAAAPGDGWNVPSFLQGVGGGDSSWYMYGRALLESDPSGNVFSAYAMYNGTGYYMIGNRFVPGFGWTGAKVISNVSLATYSIPSIATDPFGNAFVSWDGWNGTNSTVHYAFYSSVAGWLPARDYSLNVSSYVGAVRGAMDGLGNGFVTYQYYNGTTYEHWVGQVNIDGSQRPLERIEVPGSFGFYDGPIAGSPTGGAMLISSVSTGTQYDLYATQWLPGSGWQTPRPLENNSGSFSYVPAVGFDSTGQATILWYQPLSGYYVYEARWSRLAGWSDARGAIASNIYVYEPRFAFAASGAILATYYSYDYSVSRYCVGASRYNPGTGWQAPHPCVAFMTSPSSVIDISTDSTGNGLIGFGNGNDNLAYGTEFTTAGLGTAATILASTDTFAAAFISVASTGHGSGLAAVTYFNGTGYQAKVNGFAALDTAAPWATISTPLNGTSYGDGYALVTGWAEPGAQVTVNGASALTFPNGSFSAAVPLGEGFNLLRARAVDDAGNSGVSAPRQVWQTNVGPIIDAERSQAGRTGWLAPVRFDNMSFSSAWWPSIESDSLGRAWMTWYEYSPWNTVYAARYVSGTGWSVPVEIRHYNEGHIYEEPEMEIDAQGNAIFLWNELNASYTNITTWAKVWLVNGGWQPDVRVDNASQWAYQFEAAASNDGRFIVTWRQDESPTPQVYAMQYRVGVGWDARTRVSSPGNVTHVPGITYNSTGHALLVAAIRVGVIDTINIATMTPAGVWSNFTPLQNLTTYIGGHPAIKAGLGSNYTVTWTQVNASLRDTRAGRFMNGSWQGSELLFGNSWDWDSEIFVDAQGFSFVAQTESSTGTANAFVSVSRPGQPFGPAAIMDNGTLHGGGPRLVPSFDRMNMSVMWDEQEGGMSRGNMRTYNKATGTWSPVMRVMPESGPANIPDGAPMPDGGIIAAYCAWDPTFNGYHITGIRYIPPETNAPPLTVTNPLNGFFTTSPNMRVEGTTESGAFVTINGIIAAVAANGSFALDLPLVNGTNSILITARDAAGNLNFTWRNGTFDDPDRRRIETVEAQNAALQAQLNATNASLTAALAAQNANLLGAISGLNASILAQLAAQNSSLLGAIASLNSSLLASLAAQNATLANLIAQTNSSLLAQLAAQNASLLAQLAAQNSSLLNLIAQTNASLLASLAAGDAQLASLIASTNASLLASLAAQNAALLTAIAQTNATLFAQLAAQNTALLTALAGQNASLLAQMAAEDQALAQLIADTNSDLLAELAAQNASLLDALAQQDVELLASLAAQNSALLATIALTNASLLANLAATNATLYAQLTAGDGAVWAALNSSAAAQQASLSSTQSGLETTNGSLKDTQDDVARVDQAAANAALMGTLGLILGLAGVGVAVMSLMMARRGGRPPSGGESLRAPPPTPGGAHPVDAEVVSSGGPNHGHSMAAESELGGSDENQ